MTRSRHPSRSPFGCSFATFAGTFGFSFASYLRFAPLGCAYSGAPIEAALAAKNVEPKINEPERSGDRQQQAARRVRAANQKGTRGHPLTKEQKASNREKSRTRSRVEHVFAQMSGSMKALYQRCIGLKRNAAGLTLTNLVYNMLRFEQIQRLELNATA